jgi:hypothetical protein
MLDVTGWGSFEPPSVRVLVPGRLLSRMNRAKLSVFVLCAVAESVKGVPGTSPMRDVLTVNVGVTHSVVSGTQYLLSAAHHALLSSPGPKAVSMDDRRSSESPFHVAVTISREVRSPGRPPSAVPSGGP